MSSNDSLLSYMVTIRRALHQSPELAFQEKKTAQRIIEELKQLQIPCEYSGPGSGVIAKIPATLAGAPTIALRAEMDALPGEENTHLPFSSQEKGKMHACGHDAHIAMLLGAARILHENPAASNVLLIFQPAEESGGGARSVIETGCLDDACAIFAGHVTHHFRVGEIMIGHGIITAQSDRFEIIIRGKGGHGARPHEATDAVIIAASLVNTIQTLVSRETDPLHPSVITIGELQAGSAPNVIAEHAVMRGSIRSTQKQTREHIHKGLKRMTSALAILHDAEIELTVMPGYPPVVNTDREVELAIQAASKVVGKAGVQKMEYPSMGSEDFSFYLEKLPGCYVRFGARREEQQFIPLHSPMFDIDESMMLTGARYFAQLAFDAANFYRDDSRV